MNKNTSFNNLIDLCIEFDENPETQGDTQKMFVELLTSYFFKIEIDLSKKFGMYFENFKGPDFLKDKANFIDVDTSELEKYIESDIISETFSGKIMLSKDFLKAFYPGSTPKFNSLSEDQRFELIDKIKAKNNEIISAFKKMDNDYDAIKNRKILNLIALILKNIHLRTGRLFAKTDEPIINIIERSYSNADEIFTGNEQQLRELNDATKIKALIKTIFMIKQFKDIPEITEIFDSELKRFTKRTIWTSQNSS